MPETRALDEDLMRVYSADPERRGVIFMLYWGDEVTLLEPSQLDDQTTVRSLVTRRHSFEEK